MTNYKLYLGEFSYFATGEGHHNYLNIISAANETEALNVFIDRAMKKWYPPALHNEESRKFVSYGCKVTLVNEMDLKDYDAPLKDILVSVKDICKKGGMGDGGFEYYFSFNLS